jgi:hypothetical protein
VEKFQEKKDELFKELLAQINHNAILVWIPEFSYEYEQAELRGLYILYSDGRDLLYHNFNPEKQQEVDPGLVSGMFSAITSFIQETTKSSDLLRTIDSGEIKVILEYCHSYPVFGALFTDRETADIRAALQEVMNEFEKKYGKILVNWDGDMTSFANAQDIINKFFGEYM